MFDEPVVDADDNVDVSEPVDEGNEATDPELEKMANDAVNQGGDDADFFSDVKKLEEGTEGDDASEEIKEEPNFMKKAFGVDMDKAEEIVDDAEETNFMKDVFGVDMDKVEAEQDADIKDEAEIQAEADKQEANDLIQDKFGIDMDLAEEAEPLNEADQDMVNEILGEDPTQIANEGADDASAEPLNEAD